MEPFIAASVVSSASTVMPASLEPGLRGLAFDGEGQVLVASARWFTAATTWFGSCLATEVPAMVVPGRASE